MTYITKTHSLIVLPEGEPMYSEMATIIGVDDEAAGPFVTLTQHGNTERSYGVSFGPKEWQHTRAAVERMIEEWEVKDEW